MLFVSHYALMRKNSSPVGEVLWHASRIHWYQEGLQQAGTNGRDQGNHRIGSNNILVCALANCISVLTEMVGGPLLWTPLGIALMVHLDLLLVAPEICDTAAKRRTDNEKQPICYFIGKSRIVGTTVLIVTCSGETAESTLGKWSLHSRWNFNSTFTELPVHVDERWIFCDVIYPTNARIDDGQPSSWLGDWLTNVAWRARPCWARWSGRSTRRTRRRPDPARRTSGSYTAPGEHTHTHTKVRTRDNPNKNTTNTAWQTLRNVKEDSGWARRTLLRILLPYSPLVFIKP